VTGCEHCDTVAWRQAQFAWGGQPLTGAMPLPAKYYSPDDAAGMYDGDPGPCPCGCHDVWREFLRLVG
jgi:hypothetical protein